ncbi:MAG: hypothetical protein EBT21_00375 [Actinobacteria bacterium]|nr:hypothetical protein [Actinomycetota bacterium]
MRKFFLFSLLIALLVGSNPLPAFANHANTPVTIRILSQDGSEESSFTVPSANVIGGMSVAVADLGSDGKPEILLGNGLGNEPRVHVMRQDGSEVGSFLAYDQGMGVGVNVAACDLDGDGMNEIVTVPQRGGAPHVRVFNNFGSLIDPGFFAYDQGLRSGVNLTCADMDGDGAAELVTLPSAGAGPDVKIWDRTNGSMRLETEFFAFDATDTRGIIGAIIGKKLRYASQQGKEHLTYDYDLSTASSAQVSDDLNTDDALGATGMFADGDRAVRTTANAQLVDAITRVSTAVDTASGAVVGAAGDLDGDGTNEIVTAETRPLFGENVSGKRIVVDISEQRLYAYENGLLDDSFLVSTARAPHVTPLGEHVVIAKLPLVHYAGGRGADAYDLGWIPYNLRFYEHIYIHYAPWNHNFGHTLSHGCVNVSFEDIKWIYEWASVGVPVIVRT